MAAFTLRGLTCIVIACFLLLAPASEAAITCGTVIGSLSSCLPYAFGRTPTPGSACCGGVKSLYSAAKMQADRQTVCTCLKGYAGKISGINYGRVASLPKQCGVSLPYAISPSTNCNTIP
ncbi:non-specific lipid-transfer protein-like [Nymphaea colorata]|nr:non-specific lipid-transfer protein-like [Nymphaea colorata]